MMKSIPHTHPRIARIGVGLLALALAIMLATVAPSYRAAASGLPSGERTNGMSTLEPVYDDMSGAIRYVSTPDKAPMHANPTAWAPFYLPVYPLSAADAIGVVNCAHTPADNCPDHGPEVAGAAMQIMPSVYGAGVWGHDHLMAGPGSGGDFNVAWEPVLVLFTSSAAANTHITTLAQINAAVASHNAILVPLPQLTFHCSVVSASLYAHSTPVTPV